MKLSCGYRKQAGGGTQAKISSETEQNHELLPEARISWEDAQTYPEQRPDPALSSPAGMGSKGDAQPEHEAPRRTNGQDRAMTAEGALPSITSTDAASENCPYRRRSRR